MNFASKRPCIQKGLFVNPLKQRSNQSEKLQHEMPDRFVQNNAKLKSIEEIPSNYRHIFNSYKTFNSVQSKVFNDVFCTNKSIIISAPTGSGKTVIFEFAIVQLLMKLRENSSYEDFKIVYVAPIKSLCSEKYYDWTQKFGTLGIICKEVTGDSDVVDFNELSSVKLIITTPEKWDSLTRKWKDNEECVLSIKLFLIDEVHLLNEDVRGPILETIVSRMKTIQFYMKMRKGNEMKLRFVAASATIPNIEDLALWLGGKEEVCFHQIAEEERPVKLERHVIGFNSNCSGFKFDMSLNYKLSGVIRRFSEGKPSLVFCSSRKAVEMASAVLLKESPLIPLSDNQKYALIQLSKKLQDTKLQNLVIKAIAYHHAGLSYEDRTNIEKAFRSSLILVLVSTNTLAVGVNLPAHLVVIKSTEMFVCGSVIEYSESAILQMIGRAGRPQYDTKGIAVIMTQQKNVEKFENLVSGTTPVESHLHKHLAEHLNSEIVLQTITDLEVAMEWIRSTFLYVRAIKCPKHYGFESGMTRERIEKKLEEMCLVQINALETEQLITKDQAFGISVGATEFGRLMARYYISFDTMKLFRKIRGDESLLDILNTIIHCKEFSEFTIRVNDKKTLNDLNNKPIRFPIKGKVKNCENKASCLIQSVLGNITIPEPSLVQDSLKMCRLGERISKCLLEYVRLSEKRLGDSVYKALLNSVLITKCLKAKLWENSEFVCKQLKKIGAVYSSLLVSAGKTTLKSLLDTDPRTLEMILNKPPPFGNDIHDGLAAFPEYTLQFHLKNSNYVQIIVQQSKPTFDYNGRKCFIIVGDTNNNLLLFSDKINYIIHEHGKFERTFKIVDKNVKSIHANLIHENLVGVDKTASIILNTEDDFDTTKKSKRKIQTKLKVSRSTNKNNKRSTRSNKSGSSVVDDISNIESLFEDDDYFEDLETNSVIILDNDEKENNLNNTARTSNFENNGNPLKRKLNNQDCVSESSKINRVLQENKENYSKTESVTNVREFMDNFKCNKRKQIQTINTSARKIILEYYKNPSCKTKDLVDSSNAMKKTDPVVDIYSQEGFRCEIEEPEFEHDSYENWLLEDFENCNGFDLGRESVENEYIFSEVHNNKENSKSNNLTLSSTLVKNTTHETKYENFKSNHNTCAAFSDQCFDKNINFEQTIIDPDLILEFDDDDFTESTDSLQVNKNTSSLDKQFLENISASSCNLDKVSGLSAMNQDHNHSVSTNKNNENKLKTINQYFKPVDKAMITSNPALLNNNKQLLNNTSKNTNELSKYDRKDQNSREAQRSSLEMNNSLSDHHSQKAEVVKGKQVDREFSTISFGHEQEKYIQSQSLPRTATSITLSNFVINSNDKFTKMHQSALLEQVSVYNNSMLNMTSKSTASKNNFVNPYLTNQKNTTSLSMDNKNNPKEIYGYKETSETLIDNQIVVPKLNMRSQENPDTSSYSLEEPAILDLSKSTVLNYSKHGNTEIDLNFYSEQSEPLNFSIYKHTSQKDCNSLNKETTEIMNCVLDFSTKRSENKILAHQCNNTSIASTTEGIEQIVKTVQYPEMSKRLVCSKETDQVTQKYIQKISQEPGLIQQKANLNRISNFQDINQNFNQQILSKNTPFHNRAIEPHNCCPKTPKENSLFCKIMEREMHGNVTIVDDFKNVKNTKINYEISKSIPQSTPKIIAPTIYTQHQTISNQSFCESTFLEELSSVTESLEQLSPTELEDPFYKYTKECEEQILFKAENAIMENHGESSFDHYLSGTENTNCSNSGLVKVEDELRSVKGKHLNLKFIQSVQPANIFGPIQAVNPIFNKNNKAARLRIKSEPRMNREQIMTPLCGSNTAKRTSTITKNISGQVWEQPSPKIGVSNTLNNSRDGVHETIVKINTMPQPPDILNIITQMQKQKETLDLNETIHSLCDNGLSKSFQINIQNSVYEHISDDENPDEILSSTAKNFISENEIDNKFTYTKIYESTSKTMSNQIVRLPDLQSEVVAEAFNSPTPNYFNDSKLMSFESKSNRYRLKIPRRQKILPVDEKVRGSRFNVQPTTSFLNTIKQEIAANSECEYMEDWTEFLFGDNCKKNVFVKTENCEDDFLNDLTKWEPDGNECIFEEAERIVNPFTDDLRSRMDVFGDEDNNIKDESDFESIFSQNLNNSGSIFS